MAELERLRAKVAQLEKIQTEHKNVMEAMLESELRFRMIFDNANDGIILHNNQGHIFDVNQTMFKRLGYTKQEMLKMNLKDLVTPEYGAKVDSRVRKLHKEGVAIFESADIRKDGTVMPVEVSAGYTEYRGKKIIQSVVRDIAERKMAEDLIKSTFEEKDLLLDEVKQQIDFTWETLSQNLKYLSDNISDEKSKEVLKGAQFRLKTMIYIQKKMFRSPSLSRIDFSHFVKRLVPFVYSLYQTETIAVRIRQRVQDIFLDIRCALRCAFIISEFLSNSLKHAFPDDRNGEVRIEMEKRGNGTYVLSYKDNGIGIPHSIKEHGAVRTQGLRTVFDLVKEMSGQIELLSGAGTEFIVRF